MIHESRPECAEGASEAEGTAGGKALGQDCSVSVERQGEVVESRGKWGQEAPELSTHRPWGATGRISLLALRAVVGHGSH